MTLPRTIARRVAVAVAGIVAAGCGSPTPTATSASGATASPIAVPSASVAAPPTPKPTAATAGELVDVGGYRLWIECEAEGSPTVVFEAGLGSGHEAWSRTKLDVADGARVCVYDRAGLGRSEPRPAASATAGAMADELGRLLASAGISGKVVLVGHSYGGMVVQLIADRHPELVAGVVLIDSSSGPQFDEPFPVTDHVWLDGSTEVDQPGSVAELDAVDLGAIPLVVLTQDGLEGEIGAMWTRYQVGLAEQSSNALHLTASGAGHTIQNDAPELVAAVIASVIDAVAGAALPPCEEFEAVGGACLEG